MNLSISVSQEMNILYKSIIGCVKIRFHEKLTIEM